MKKFFIILCTIMCMVFSFTVDAQDNKSYVKEGTTFVQQKKSSTSNAQKTAYTWKDSKGISYPIYLTEHKKGEKAGIATCFVMKVSQKTGKEYRYYLPDGEKIAEEILRENL